MPTADWSITMASGCSRRNAWWISELLPEPATPVTTVSTPVGIAHADILEVVHIGVGDRQVARGLAKLGFDRQGLLEVRAGQGIGLEQPGVGAFEDDLAAARAGVRAHIHDVVGDLMTSGSCSTTMTVLPLSRSFCSSSLS